MKNIFYTFSLFASALYLSGCASSNSLKANIDDYNFTTSYLQLPRKPLDTAYHTYSVNVETGLTTGIAVKKDDIVQRIEIAGWKKLRYDAHVQIKTKFEDVIIQGSEIKEKVDAIKSKDGKDSASRSTFYVEVTYSFASRATLTDYKGQLIQNLILGERDQIRIYKSEFFENVAEAKAYSKYGLIMLTSQLTKESIGTAITDLNNNLSYNYGFAEVRATDILWILSSKNHPEYEAHRRAYVAFKQAIGHLTSDGPLEEVRNEMKPVIEYFNSVKKKYTTGDKNDRKMIYASCYNLSKIYYYLDDAEGAMNEANQLVMNGYDAKHGQFLEAAANDLKILLRDTKFKNRHFPLRIEQYQGPGVISRN